MRNVEIFRRKYGIFKNNRVVGWCTKKLSLETRSSLLYINCLKKVYFHVYTISNTYDGNANNLQPLRHRPKYNCSFHWLQIIIYIVIFLNRSLHVYHPLCTSTGLWEENARGFRYCHAVGVQNEAGLAPYWSASIWSVWRCFTGCCQNAWVSLWCEGHRKSSGHRARYYS